MKIAQLFHKLRVISNVEIVVPLLPEMLRIANQTPRYNACFRTQPWPSAQATLTVQFETPPRRFLNDTVSPNFTHRRAVR